VLGPARCTKAPANDGGLRLGYACVNTGLPSSGRTVRLRNATADRLRKLIAANLDALDAILRWNAEHGIDVFRVTSNLIPFGSHPVNRIAWWEEFGERLHEIGACAGRLSTHPGQYTVLSSVNASVVDAAVAELEYHSRLLDALGRGPSHKIVLHVGSIERFEAGFDRLSERARSRLVLENDERQPLSDVLPLAKRLGAPVVFDVFHHRLAPSFDGLSTCELVEITGETWSEVDGRQKIHFSTQAPGKRPGAHADTIDTDSFRELVDEVGDLPLDCMLEVKDKEQSVLRAKELLGSAYLALARYSSGSVRRNATLSAE
jgi:UV DNA damage endonuclease